MASTARFVVDVTIADPSAFAALAAVLDEHRGARGEVRAVMALPQGGEATVLLGRDFRLDGELASTIEALHGVASVALKTSETRLALVG